MSFLLSLSLLSWFPALWVSSTALGFLGVQLTQHELLQSWASAVLDLCLTGAKARLLQPGYIRVLAPDMSGECVISSVWSHCSKDLKWWTNVTVQSLLATTTLDSFFLF